MEEKKTFCITDRVSIAQFQEAVGLYYESFEPKIRPLLKSREKALAIYREAIQKDRVHFALLDGQSVGLIGLQYGNRDFACFGLEVLRKHYPFFRSLCLAIMLNAFKTRLEEDCMRIDSIAVSGRHRGQGIGTKLLEKALATAKRLRYREMLLEVVDTNPRAKKLYESMGFQQKRQIRFFFLTRAFGFSSAYILSKKIL